MFAVFIIADSQATLLMSRSKQIKNKSQSPANMLFTPPPHTQTQMHAVLQSLFPGLISEIWRQKRILDCLKTAEMSKNYSK